MSVADPSGHREHASGDAALTHPSPPSRTLDTDAGAATTDRGAHRISTDPVSSAREEATVFYRWLRRITQRLTLSAHLFLCLGLTAAVPTLLLGGVQTRWWAAIQVDQADYQSRLAAQAVAREVGLVVESHARAVEGLARQIEAQGMDDPTALQRMTVRQRQAFDTFPLMYIGDAAGLSVAADPSFDIFGAPSFGRTSVIGTTT